MIRQTHKSARLFKEQVSMCTFTIHVICNPPIPPSTLDSNDELANLHVIKSAMKHVAHLQKLKRSADGQPGKNQYQHCSKEGEYKEDNPGATQGDNSHIIPAKKEGTYLLQEEQLEIVG